MHVVRIVQKSGTKLVMKEYFPRHFHPKIHAHKNTEIFRIMRGRGIIHIGGEKLEVKRGDNIVIAPGKFHGVETMNTYLYCYVEVHGGHEGEISALYDMFVNKPI